MSYSRFLAALAVLSATVACRAPDRPTLSAPRAEFLVATADSTYWVTSGPAGVRVRGMPLQLARVDGRYYEVYAMDDDRSYEDALLVGQLVFRRDLESGDSALVFADTLVPRIASAYARANPDEQPLGPDDDGAQDPSTVASVDVGILDVHGPYLSFEYHADIELPGRTAQSWHSTRHGVLDLRSGRTMTVRQLFGAAGGARIADAGQRAYRAIADSVRRSAGVRGRRAARALASFRFDETSFTLTNVARAPAVAFMIPGRGSSSDVVPMPLPPIQADSTSWWREALSTLPSDESDTVARWHGHGYDVVARSDTTDSLSQLVLTDGARHHWLLAILSSPARHVYWLDAPPVSAAQRRGLLRAFSEASLYDEDARTVSWRVRVRRPAPLVPQ